MYIFDSVGSWQCALMQQTEKLCVQVASDRQRVCAADLRGYMTTGVGFADFVRGRCSRPRPRDPLPHATLLTHTHVSHNYND